jgi:hypothetical protein
VCVSVVFIGSVRRHENLRLGSILIIAYENIKQPAQVFISILIYSERERFNLDIKDVDEAFVPIKHCQTITLCMKKCNNC